MKEENKKEIKKGIFTGVGTAAGAVIGAVVDNTINAADVEVKEIPEAEVVDTVVEDFNEMQPAPQITAEVETISSDIMEDVAAPPTHKPERKTTRQNNVGSDSDSSSEVDEDMETFVEADAVIEVETDSDVAVVEESVTDEDIMVVSVATEESDEMEADIYDAMPDQVNVEEVSEDVTLAPDYIDMKDNDVNVGGSIISAVDMPDYVNDANIDSFTDNV